VAAQVAAWRATEIPGVSDRRFRGTLGRLITDLYTDWVKLAVLSCAELDAIGCGGSVILAGRMAQGRSQGEALTFRVALRDGGRLLAMDVHFGGGGSKAGPPARPADELGRFEGKIARDGSGFSFAECGGLRSVFGRRAFVSPGELGDLRHGEAVSFDAVLHESGLL